MPLEAGTKLGPYEVTAPIGAGGMGEVYRARDRKLDRDVAIKVLPEEFASDPERLARFEREAKLLAALNHPNIASIHGFEESDGVNALVLELVEGPTLSERIAQGPIPVEEAVAIVKQIAGALEAGHEAGVIHRDLKPANIKLTEDGTVKVLDYGLAKAFERESPSGTTDSELSQSPTLMRHGTQVGVILGTAAYMSPEQAKGKRVDKRTDIWAFGAVVYELLTGRRAFSGDDVSDTLAAILKDEPDWSRLPSETPARLERLLRRCLRKDPTRRIRDMGDARIELEDDADEQMVVTTGNRSRTFALATAAVVASGLGVWLLAPSGADVAPRLVTRTEILLPEGASLAFGLAPMIALAPDGRNVAFVAAEDGVERIYLRSLDALQARLVPGTEGAVGLFFSPDGRWIGFSRDGITLEKVSVTGGAPVALTTENGRMATWAPDGTVVFTRYRRGLSRVSLEGGASETLTTPDRERREKTHRLPHVLPDGSAVLYTDGSADIESFDDASIAVLDFSTGESRTLIEGGSNPLYVSSGHLVYARAGDILAVPFDAVRLEVKGPPVTVLQGVVTALISGKADISISRTGDLLYAPAPGSIAAPTFPVVWIDRAGSIETLTETRGNYFDARISPDGKSLALNVAAANNSIWLYDLSRAAATRLVVGFENMAPVWGPSADRLAFSSSRSGAQRLHLLRLDSGEAPELLVAGEAPQWPTSWSADGRWLAYDEVNTDRGDDDIWVLPMTGERVPEPLLRTPSNERSLRFAPNGRFVAYVSDETGRSEIYIQSFPAPDVRRPVSNGGGDWPVWSSDGGELFYRNGTEVWGATVEARHELTLGAPRRLFDVDADLEGPFDVSADGERFVFIDRRERPSLPTHLVLVQSWAEELKRLVPTP